MQPNSFCWSTRGVPLRVVDIVEDSVLLEDDRLVPMRAVAGFVNPGDRVRGLFTGRWLWGVVANGDRLVIELDNGKLWEVRDANLIAKQIGSNPK